MSIIPGINLSQVSTSTIGGLLLISIWVVIWKGLALWHAARNEQNKWFIAILVLNTLGLLPIIYLIWYKPQK